MDDQLRDLSISYLDACTKLDETKRQLMLRLQELIFRRDDTESETDTDETVTKKIGYFKQWLILKSDGDIYFDIQFDNNNPYMHVGYTSGPNGDPLDIEIQEMILNVCHELQLGFAIDFNDEPVSIDGRVTYMFSLEQ